MRLDRRAEAKYREVATDPHAEFHFHTGRYLAKHLGYDDEFVGYRRMAVYSKLKGSGAGDR